MICFNKKLLLLIFALFITSPLLPQNNPRGEVLLNNNFESCYTNVRMGLTHSFAFWNFLTKKGYYNKIISNEEFIKNSTIYKLDDVRIEPILTPDKVKHAGIIEFIGSLCRFLEPNDLYDFPDFGELLLLDFEKNLFYKSEYDFTESNYFYFSKLVIYNNQDYAFKILNEITARAVELLQKILPSLQFEEKIETVFRQSFSRKIDIGFRPVDFLSYLFDLNPIEVMNGETLMFDLYLIKFNTRLETFLFSLVHELMHINPKANEILSKDELNHDDYCYLAVYEEFRAKYFTDLFKTRFINNFQKTNYKEPTILNSWELFKNDQKSRINKMKFYFRNDLKRTEILNHIDYCFGNESLAIFPWSN